MAEQKIVLMDVNQENDLYPKTDASIVNYNYKDEETVTTVKAFLDELKLTVDNLQISIDNMGDSVDKFKVLMDKNGGDIDAIISEIQALGSDYESLYALAKKVKSFMDGDHDGTTLDDIYKAIDDINDALKALSGGYVAGYYWSKEKDGNDPVDPQYVGTTASGFEISESQPYLWYTNDGSTWTLVQYLIEPDPDYYYVQCSIEGDWQIVDTGAYYNFPAGFFCFIGSDGKAQTNFGKSWYLSGGNKLSTSSFDASVLKTVIDNTKIGTVSYNASYNYLYKIHKDSDPTDLTAWSKESSFSLSNTFVEVSTMHQGNFCAPTPYEIVELDDNNVITRKLWPLDGDYDYSENQGTAAHWNDPDWIKYFLMCTFEPALRANESFYNEKFGFNFNYNGQFILHSYDGLVTAIVGSPVAPTSDDPSDAEYYTTQDIPSLSVQFVSNQWMIRAYFSNVRIGMKSNIYFATNGLNVGDKITTSRRFWNVTFDSRRILVTETRTGETTILGANADQTYYLPITGGELTGKLTVGNTSIGTGNTGITLPSGVTIY